LWIVVRGHTTEDWRTAPSSTTHPSPSTTFSAETPAPTTQSLPITTFCRSEVKSTREFSPIHTFPLPTFFPSNSIPTFPERMSRWTFRYSSRFPTSFQYPSAMYPRRRSPRDSISGKTFLLKSKFFP